MMTLHRFHIRVMMLILSTVLLSSATAWSDDGPANMEIKLKDGQVLHGVLRQIKSGGYLVQSENDLFELTAAEIKSVDGKPGIPELKNKNLVHATMHRVQLQSSGSLLMWSYEEITNTHDEILTYAMFGAKERELPTMRAMKAYDQFGTQLNVRIEPRAGTDIHNVFIDFDVPILPGESMRGSLRHEFQGQITCEGSRCRNEFSGGFPEDRLHTRRLELPKGAKLLKVEPKPNLQFDFEGKTVVVWRRYYPVGTYSPLVVEYELKK